MPTSSHGRMWASAPTNEKKGVLRFAARFCRRGAAPAVSAEVFYGHPRTGVPIKTFMLDIAIKRNMCYIIFVSGDGTHNKKQHHITEYLRQGG